MFNENKLRLSQNAAAVIQLINAYQSGFRNLQVTTAEVQKLLYFYQFTWADLNLSFQMGENGPFDKDLCLMLQNLEEHLIFEVEDDEEICSATQIQLTPDALEYAKDVLRFHPETEEKIERVEEIIDCFESSTALELLANVHWCALRVEGEEAQLDSLSRNSCLAKFTDKQIGTALQMLKRRFWLRVADTELFRSFDWISALSEQNPFDAIRLYTNLLKEYPIYYELYEKRANQLFEIGEYQDAVQDCKKGLALAPNNANLAQIMSRAYACLTIKSKQKPQS